MQDNNIENGLQEISLESIDKAEDFSLLISSLDIDLETLSLESKTEDQQIAISEKNEIIDLIENIPESIVIEETSVKIEDEDIAKILESADFEPVEYKLPEEGVSILNNSFSQEVEKINKSRKHRRITDFIYDKVKFVANYIVVSTFVFFILLAITNYSAYSTIAYNYMNPDNLKNSSKEILSAIDNSKIKVFADEDNSFLGKEQQEKIQKNLAESNEQLRDTYFSPKKLVPLRSNVNLSIDITPYENRIMIPKIGKNIPLVDVDSRRGVLDFNNLESLFMTELEKGVLRYPGTAKPGENGNTFIFGHSSNYAWDKGQFNDVFALLDNLESGDEIIIYYNQKKYVYVINEKKVIKPGNTKILERDPSKKELTLMTCWPVGTTLNRLVTFGELKEVTSN